MRNKKTLHILPVLWMGLSLFLHQRAEESSQVSGWFINIVQNIAHILNLDITGWDLSFLIRKGAHFSVFALLGILLFIAFYVNRQRLFSSAIISFLIGSAYGVFDELHQYFVPGRSCQVTDMAIDASGVLTAILFCVGCIF